ncbi:MAG: hypothetical protein WCQ72_01705 [Eubacteriales bacterium]
MPKRIVSALLLCAMLVSFASCGSAEQASKPSVTTADKTTEAQTTAAPTNDDLLAATKAALPGGDFNGYTFTILDRAPEKDANWETLDAFSAEADGDPIHDAVYNRNRMIEEKYNVTIAENKVKNPFEDAAKLILAGDDAFDVLTDGLDVLSKNLAAQNYLIDLNTISALSLEKDCWDQAMNTGLSIMNKNYYATGDISIMDNYGTWCMMFNKALIENYQLDNPYELVNSGAWTLDKFYSMSTAAAQDINGDGVMNDDDQYGFLSEGYNTFGLWSGSGEMAVSKDADDLPYLSVMNDRSASVIEKVIAIQSDKAVTHTGDQAKDGMNTINEMYKNGQSLFIFGGMWLITRYRDSEIDFGIIPTPKYDEAQENYFNTYSYCNMTAYSIPVTSTDPERTGTILEAMAELSKYTLTPAYMDVALKGKYLRDNESESMIDLVLSNRSYDLAAIYDWGGVFAMFSSMYSSKKSDMASRYEKLKIKAETAIEKYITTIEG